MVSKATTCSSDNGGKQACRVCRHSVASRRCSMSLLRVAYVFAHALHVWSMAKNLTRRRYPCARPEWVARARLDGNAFWHWSQTQVSRWVTWAQGRMPPASTNLAWKALSQTCSSAVACRKLRHPLAAFLSRPFQLVSNATCVIHAVRSVASVGAPGT